MSFSTSRGLPRRGDKDMKGALSALEARCKPAYVTASGLNDHSKLVLLVGRLDFWIGSSATSLIGPTTPMEGRPRFWEI